MKTPTLAEFKRFAQDNARLASAVCLAQSFAQCERERVDAYTRPVFEAANLTDDKGDVITDLRHAWLCRDAEATGYYADLDKAHRANGFTGPDGHCPALIADAMRIDAENALIASGCEMLGLKDANLYGAHRRQMLDLLLGACLKRDDERKAA